MSATMPGWRFIAGRWVPMRRVVDLSKPWEERKAEIQAMVDTGEDIELFATELGISRAQAQAHWSFG